MHDPTRHEPQSDLEAVWQGLSASEPTLNPKWFYDAQGSALFDAITRQPEYYLTDCEREILRRHGDEIGRWIGPDAVIAELGAGSGEKAVLLISALDRPAAYVPVDISAASLAAACQAMRSAFPHLTVQGWCGDFRQGLDWPDLGLATNRCVLFLGSTIGNMEPREALDWLGLIRRQALEPGNKVLVGVDLKKDPVVLNAAYNDAMGVTDAFNRNALLHLNHVFGTNFDPGKFRHQAFYNPDKGRVEMHLECLAFQTVTVGQRTLTFRPGDRIHTENSYKYTLKEFQSLADEAGLGTQKIWTDPRGWFSLFGLMA